MRTAYEILSVAAVVYDQDRLSEADQIFLDAINKAGREWGEALDNANKTFGGGSDAWNAVKNLATRERDAQYRKALDELEAREDAELLQAAE